MDGWFKLYPSPVCSWDGDKTLSMVSLPSGTVELVGKVPPCFGWSQETYEEMNVITYGFFFFSFRDLDLLEKKEKRESLVCRDLGYGTGMLLAWVCQVHVLSCSNIYVTWWPPELLLLPFLSPQAGPSRPLPAHFALFLWLSSSLE